MGGLVVNLFNNVHVYCVKLCHNVRHQKYDKGDCHSHPVNETLQVYSADISAGSLTESVQKITLIREMSPLHIEKSNL